MKKEPEIVKRLREEENLKLFHTSESKSQIDFDIIDESQIDLSKETKSHMLKPKELYHKLGYWEQLINYIKKIGEE